MFSRAGIWTIAILGFLVIWAGTFAGALAIKERLIGKTKHLPTQEESFSFAEPTEEERAAMEANGADDGDIVIPLMAPLSVFSCPSKKCGLLGTIKAGEDLVIAADSVPDKNGWITIIWNHADKGPQNGFIYVEDVATSYQPPAPLPEEDMALDPDDLVPEKDTPLNPVPIDPQTLVGIACDFESNDQLSEKKTTRASGAIITDDGYVLTARGVVDIGYLNEGLDTFKLKQCYIGQLPASAPLPSIPAIRTINAFVRVPYLAYLAEVAYIPSEGDASDYENAWMDFAVLKITDINPDAKYFGGPTHLPESFPTAPILISELPKIGNETLNFSFPSGTTFGNNSDIKTLFMQGLISSVTGYWAGDKRYADGLFLIESHLDTEDTAGGRFGSPIFWKGYVIGIHTAKQQQSRQIYNVSAKAILENLFDNQFIIPIDVQ